jgi:uncharacterized membrane protein
MSETQNTRTETPRRDADAMFSMLAVPMRAVGARETRLVFMRGISPCRIAVLLLALLAAAAVAALTAAAGHVELLHRMPIFSGAQAISGVTEFLDNIKGYLLSIVLAGFTVAGIAVGAAKLTGHSRANDMLFNVGVGIAIFAALPTLVA